MRNAFIVMLAILFAVSARVSFANEELEILNKRLNIIADFADRICKNIPLEGEENGIKLSGEADAEINYLISRLVNLGVKGAGEYKSENYKNVLRTDLLIALKDEKLCKEKVIDRFDGHFSAANIAGPKPSGSPCKVISGKSSECLSKYCLPGPHPQVEGSGYNYCVSAIKNCAIPGGDGAMYKEKLSFNGVLLTCLNPNKFGYSGKWAQFFQP